MRKAPRSLSSAWCFIMPVFELPVRACEDKSSVDHRPYYRPRLGRDSCNFGRMVDFCRIECGVLRRGMKIALLDINDTHQGYWFDLAAVEFSLHNVSYHDLSDVVRRRLCRIF